MDATAGARRRQRAQGPKHERLAQELVALDPLLAEWVDNFIFGEVWGRDGLSEDERMLAAIAALAATEHPNQLRNYLHGALHAGISPRKIHETLVMMVVYAGFPAALTALITWREVLASARRHGLIVNLDLPADKGPA